MVSSTNCLCIPQDIRFAHCTGAGSFLCNMSSTSSGPTVLHNNCSTSCSLLRYLGRFSCPGLGSLEDCRSYLQCVSPVAGACLSWVAANTVAAWGVSCSCQVLLGDWDKICQGQILMYMYICMCMFQNILLSMFASEFLVHHYSWPGLLITN